MGNRLFNNTDDNCTYAYLNSDDAGVGDIVCAIKIEHGLQIEVRDTTLKELEQDNRITDKYHLNVKRINRWWYSVYFHDKERSE